MTELVSRTDTDEGVFRAQYRQLRLAHRSLATVMTDLENVDVSELAVRDEWPEHLLFCIAREHRRERAFIRPQHDARLICRRIIDRTAGPERLEPQRAYSESRARRNLGYSSVANELPCLIDRRVRRCLAPGRQKDLPHANRPLQRSEPAVVIGMQMGEHYGVQFPHPESGQRGPHGAVGGAGVNQHGVAAIANQNRVALTHVKHDNLSPTRRRRSERECCHQSTTDAQDHLCSKACWARPPRPQHRRAE